MSARVRSSKLEVRSDATTSRSINPSNFELRTSNFSVALS